MKNNELVKVKGHDGTEIAVLNLLEYKLLLKLFDEMCGITEEEFRELLCKGEREEIKERLLDIFETGRALIGSDYLSDSEIDDAEGLWKKFKDITATQAVYLFDTLFSSSNFMYMFEHKTHDEISEVEKKVREKRRDIIKACPDGISTHILAKMIRDEYPNDYLHRMAQELEDFVDYNGIPFQAKYVEDLKAFKIRFGEESEDIEITLDEILEYKLNYQKTFPEALEGMLIYSLSQLGLFLRVEREEII